MVQLYPEIQSSIVRLFIWFSGTSNFPQTLFAAIYFCSKASQGSVRSFNVKKN